VRRQEESSFCEQKEAKKLFPFGDVSIHHAAPRHKSFFASFFPKKEDSSFPSFAYATPKEPTPWPA
jgi:hypothetical protein